MFALTPRTSQPMARVSRDEMPFGWLTEEFPALFDRLFAGWPVMEMPERLPRMTMEEREKEILVRTELPGFEPAEVRVELLGEMLMIEAEHRVAAENTEAATDRTYAHMRREMSLPAGVDTEKIEATYRNGVLEIHLPRSPEAVGRRIEVRS